jgi:hypothetical protein
MLICNFPALAEAFPVQSRGLHSSLIEDAKGRVVVRSAKPMVVRKSSSLSLSLTIIRKEQRSKRKKFVIPDIPKPK